MKFVLKSVMLSVLLAASALAQFRIANGKVQVHGFFSQGFIKSDQNNYLTMNTSAGSGAMTDGGLNISWRATDKLRFSAQGYTRNIGQLTNFRPELDFAFIDYRWRDWLGFRGGKVKTVLGLYNDTQDMEFLHTFALLPQSIYPADLRASTIAHVGGDLYGSIPVKRWGVFSYTLHAGLRPDDDRGGFHYGLADAGLRFTAPVEGWSKGADVRWATPVDGLTLGASWFDAYNVGSGMLRNAFGTAPFRYDTRFDRTGQQYVEYQKGHFRLMGEYRRNYATQAIFSSGRFLRDNNYQLRSWYVGGSWRASRKLEFGSYHSRYRSDCQGCKGSHFNDSAITARVDINKYWNFKVEGHFMDGIPAVQSARGFYLRVNPRGFQPTTNMLILRTGFNF